jgi:hypothetical protein
VPGTLKVPGALSLLSRGALDDRPLRRTVRRPRRAGPGPARGSGQYAPASPTVPLRPRDSILRGRPPVHAASDPAGRMAAHQRPAGRPPPAILMVLRGAPENLAGDCCPRRYPQVPAVRLLKGLTSRCRAAAVPGGGSPSLDATAGRILGQAASCPLAPLPRRQSRPRRKSPGLRARPRL